MKKITLTALLLSTYACTNAHQQKATVAYDESETDTTKTEVQTPAASPSTPLQTNSATPSNTLQSSTKQPLTVDASFHAILDTEMTAAQDQIAFLTSPHWKILTPEQKSQVIIEHHAKQKSAYNKLFNIKEKSKFRRFAEMAWVGVIGYFAGNAFPLKRR
ncbi:MAG TPA: hypothetical protein VGT41_01330 [Candidatus Babeliales bacterium]|nr:hypothetical protein [Candidatus Babeliales bacterium]